MTDDELAFIASATGARRVERGPRVQSLWSGYGEIYRARLERASSSTAIVKSVRPPDRRRSDASHARKARSYDVELAWYRDLASRCDAACRVPTFLGGRSSTDRWLFVLEDLDASGFPGRRRRGADALDVTRCLAWLAAFHARFLDVEPADLWETGTYWHLATRPDELAAMEDDSLRRAAPIFDRMLRDAKFQTIVHGDAKLANFCFGEHGVAAVDFQYVGGGCGMSDVAYFLSSCSDAGDDPDEERHLDEYFAHLRTAVGTRRVDVDALEREWRALYPIAAADFYRFFAGWAKEHWATDRHGQQVVRNALREISRT